jgi:release factor glutamine methyltransferase
VTQTPKTLIARALKLGLPLTEARLLLAHAVNVPREWLITHDDDCLPEQHCNVAKAFFQRRAKGEPVAYILGEKEFYGLPFFVNNNVLIPRPETEILVDQALALLGDRAHCLVLDLGTGSGCIGLALAKTCPTWQVVLTDSSGAALHTAISNAERLNTVNTHFFKGSWWQALEATSFQNAAFDLIISNPPYIEQGNLHLTQADLRFEPQTALTDFSDGLSAYRAILQGLVDQPDRLKAGGYMLWEHGFNQADSLGQLVAASGLFTVTHQKDLAHLPRMLTAQKSSGAKMPTRS